MPNYFCDIGNKDDNDCGHLWPDNGCDLDETCHCKHRSPKPQRSEGQIEAAGSGTFPGFTEEEHEEFKRLGKMKLGEIREKDFERYKMLLNQTLKGFTELLGDK